MVSLSSFFYLLLLQQMLQVVIARDALQFLLNRAQPGLPLPAVKGRAVVLDGQQHPLKGLKIRHGNTFFVKIASSL